MQRVVYKIGDYSVKFDYALDNPYILESIEGLTAADIEVNSARGYAQNGYTLQDVGYGTRHLNITFIIVGNSRADLYEKRAFLSQVFNPLLGVGELTYTNDANTRAIYCMPTITPTTVERMGLIETCNIEMTCFNPFWHDTQYKIAMLSGESGGLTFPFKLPQVRFGANGGIATFDNVGDVAAPIRAVFTKTVNNPTITLKETGDYITVDKTIADGETLTVTTGYGEKNVILTHTDGTTESAFHTINIGSTFFELPRGTSHVDFTCADGNPTVMLYWRNYYVGV